MTDEQDNEPQADGVAPPKRGHRKGGPRTSRGKAAVKRNALGHGLRSEANLIPLDQREKLRSFGRRVERDMHAEGPVERALARHLALLLHRLGVLDGLESMALAEGEEPKPRPSVGIEAKYQGAIEELLAVRGCDLPELVLAAPAPDYSVTRIDPRQGPGIETLARMRTGIERSVARVLAELRALRADRESRTAAEAKKHNA